MSRKSIAAWAAMRSWQVGLSGTRSKKCCSKTTCAHSACPFATAINRGVDPFMEAKSTDARAARSSLRLPGARKRQGQAPVVRGVDVSGSDELV